MQANTAFSNRSTSTSTVASAVDDPRFQAAVERAVRWKKRYVFSCLRDRRSLAEIGGLNAYLTQVRWSVWWALRGGEAETATSASPAT